MCATCLLPKLHLYPICLKMTQLSNSVLEEINDLFTFSIISRNMAGNSSRQPSRDSCRILSCRKKEDKEGPYLQVLPPDINCCKGQLHLLPASVFVSLVRNLNEDQEDPGDDATSH